MEIKLAAFSPNAAIASTAQSVASGIEKAASLPAGVGGIADSFQNIPAFSPRDASSLSAVATAAMMDLPGQYASRLQDFHREASGLVPSSEFLKNLNDRDLDVAKGIKDFSTILRVKTLERDPSFEKSEIEEMKTEAGERFDQAMGAANIEMAIGIASAGAAAGSSRQVEQQDR